MHINKFVIMVVVIVCALTTNLAGQIIPHEAYQEGSPEHRQVQLLINGSVKHAEDMLVKQGAYAPYAAALTNTDSIVILEGFPGTKDKTLVHELDDLKQQLKAGADHDRYKAIVVFFDVTVTDPDTKLPTDAIAAYTENARVNGSFTFYFPYKKTEQRTIVYSPTIRGEITDSEIFLKVGRN